MTVGLNLTVDGPSVGEESEAEHGHIDQDKRRVILFVLTATLLSVSVFYDQTIRVIQS